MSRKTQRRKKPAQAPDKRNTLRIIAGQWRGRKLHFADAPGLRPTPDRLRETLFNWLQGHLGAARCLDLFAGSGALGLEALSRGAAHVTLVEQHPAAIRALHNTLDKLGTSQAELVQTDAFEYLQQPHPPYDLILLDPPFGKNYLPRLLPLIAEHKLLQTDGRLYLEYADSEASTIDIPEAFVTLRQKQAGKVVGRLLGERKHS